MRSGLEVSFSFLTPFNLVGCGAKSKMQWEGAMQGGAVQSATDVGEAALGKGTSNFLSRVPSPESRVRESTRQTCGDVGEREFQLLMMCCRCVPRPKEVAPFPWSH